MEALCVGFASLDVRLTGWRGFPGPGAHTRFFESVDMTVGGDAATQSRTLAQLGHRVGLASAVGDDPPGGVITDVLAGKGVDVSLVAVARDTPTSICLVDLKQGGERSFAAPRGGTAALIGPEHIRDDFLPEGVRVVSIGSLNCSPALDQEVLPRLLSLAKARGATVVADMVSDHLEVTLDDLSPVLQHIDYVVPSMLEMEHLCKTRDPVAAAERFGTFGVGALVVKQGVEGATLVRNGNESVRVPAAAVRAVDTTGAGDAFVAGFVSGLLRGLTEEECLHLATAVAAQAVVQEGAGAADLDLAALGLRG